MLRRPGAKDLDDYLGRDGAGRRRRMPRLVLVVDEFATLAEELPDFVGGLVGIAQRGRSLGVHLVLATQRPGGVVSADIRANTSLRIALRVTDPAESTDVVDVRDAAEISRVHPGRAVVRVGRGCGPRAAVGAGRRPRSGGHAGAACGPCRGSAPATRLAGAAGAAPTGPTDLARLVDAARAAADRIGAEPVAQPLAAAAARGRDGRRPVGVPVDDGRLALGLLDLPAEQRRAPVTFDLDGGDHLLVAGSARSGRSTVLRTLAAALAARCDVTDLHLFAWTAAVARSRPDRASPLGAVVGRTRPHAATGCSPGWRRAGAPPAAALGRRSRLARGAAPRRPARRRLPWLVLLVDGWEGLATAYESVDHGRPLETLLRLVREGAGGRASASC